MAIPTIPQITEYAGVVPDRRSQSAEDFTSAAITWTDYQADSLIPKINITVDAINAASDEIEVVASEIEQDALLAQAAANYQGDWFIGASVLKGQTWTHEGFRWVSKTDGAGEPASGVEWLQLPDDSNAIKAILIAQGLSGNYGYFANGFTYDLVGDAGIDVDGKIYIYAGNASLPIAVAAGTDPVGDGDYKHYISKFIDVFNWPAINGDKDQANTIYNAIVAGNKFQIPSRVSSLSDVFSAWVSGEKHPICFFGDSTIDGAVTTIDGTNLATVWNRDKMVGGDVPDGFNDDHDDSEVPNAYPNITQRLARQYTGNSFLRVYNAGYRGQQLINGWASSNVYNAVYGNAAYSDTKIIVINFGLNDLNAVNGDLILLAEKTKNYLEALVLDAYARGVQPVMSTTVVSSYMDGSQYDNYQVMGVIDNIKNDIAKKYNLEVIDLAKAQLDYMYYNGASESYWTISTDSLHVNDRGHLIQAQYILREMAGDLVFNISEGDNYIDLTHPAMRLKGDSGSGLSKSFGLNRGLNQRYRTLSANADYYTSLAGDNAFDLWIWNDKPECSILYCKFLDSNADASLVNDISQLPKIRILGDFGTINNTYAKDSSFLEPNLVGGGTGGDRGVVETFIKNLRYGMNRVTFEIPSTVDTSWITSNVQIGYLKIETNNVESRKPTISFSDSEITDLNFKDFSNVISNESSLTGVDSFIFNRYDRENRYSLISNGDYAEFKINAEWKSNTGVILAYNTYDNRLVSMTESEKANSLLAGSFLCLYAGGTTLVARSYSPSGSVTASYNPFAGGGDNLFASYQGKDLVIRLTRVTEKQFTIKAYTPEMVQIGSGAVIDTSSTNLRVIREFQSGYVGGIMSELASVENLVVNKLSYRVRNI